MNVLGKRFIKLIWILGTILAFTGCGGDGGSGQVSTPSAQELAFNKLKNYATSNGSSEMPTVYDYMVAGVAGVDTDNVVDINAALAAATSDDINTIQELQTLINVNDPGKDTIPPVITILGANPAEIEEGGSYVDAGATALDDRDGNVSVQTIGAVDGSLAGIYTLLYTARDSANNLALAVRTVKVNSTADTTPPVITLNGDSNMSVYIDNGAYVELGAEAMDNRDGNITSLMNISGSVNTSALGVYTITYDVRDNSGNRVVATRTVNVIARFIALGNTGVVYDRISGLMWQDNADVSSNTYRWQGAKDVCAASSLNGFAGWFLPDRYLLSDTIQLYTFGYRPGDVWSSTEAGSTSGVIVNSYNASSTAVDKNYLRYARCVRQSDIVKPILILQGGDITLFEGDSYVENAIAYDNTDGDITDNIVITGTVDTSTVGAYTLNYQITDSNGNMSEDNRTVTVISDTVAPVITILGANPVVVAQNSTYTDAGATATDLNDGDVTADIVTGGDVVDTTTLGDYTVTYTVSDAAGNESNATRTVSVIQHFARDNTANIVTDNILRLQWTDDTNASSQLLDWNGANTYCSGLSMRIPTENELRSIVDTNYTPTIQSEFVNVASGVYWTNYNSTRDGHNRVVDFSTGNTDSSYSGGNAYIRCVKSF